MKVIARDRSPASRKEPTDAESSHEVVRLMKKYPEVQLATLVETPPEGVSWLHEMKFDGYRLLGFVSDGTARLRTRNGKDWTERFPSLTAALEKLRTKSGVLDMEAVVVDPEGKSSFQALQAALAPPGTPRRSSVMSSTFCTLMVRI